MTTTALHSTVPSSPLALTPETPGSERVLLRLAGGLTVEAKDEPYSDRIRCDHPAVSDCAEVELLGRALIDLAERRGRGRVIVLAPRTLEAGLLAADYQREGLMPQFYCGREDCVVLGAYPDAERSDLAAPLSVAKVLTLVDNAGPGRAHPPVETRRAERRDAPGIAALLGETFADYPTPSSDPDYIAEAIDAGNPFRLVEDHGHAVACASADLIPQARTAELTDCATRPDYRGRGLMQAILDDLIDDLRELEYPTAFTLARAQIPGVNIAFSRLGFELCGTMPRSCRIGSGIEDMNIWSAATA